MIPIETPRSSKPINASHRLVLLVTVLSLAGWLAGCSFYGSSEFDPTTSPSATARPPAAALVLYDWPDDIPQSVLDAFSEEFGVEITYETYESQEEAIANMRAGQVYDVVVMENQFVPSLIADGLLAEIDHQQVPNFAHIASNFKNLAYDPDNHYSIPFNWGTTGLVVRSDLAPEPVTRWADLWNPTYAGKVAIRDQPRDIIGLTLKSLGFSVNSEDPAELEAARDRLREIKPTIILADGTAEGAMPLLMSGEVAILVGWSEDVFFARSEQLEVSYILPEEGALMWGDNFVIPANSSRRTTVHLFLNFLLRPEISAQITNENFYAGSNLAARPFIEPEILNDPVIFPPSTDLQDAEVLLTLSQSGEQLYTEIWEDFSALQ